MATTSSTADGGARRNGNLSGSSSPSGSGTSGIGNNGGAGAGLGGSDRAGSGSSSASAEGGSGKRADGPAALLRPAPVDRDRIPGWGADLDRHTRPAVPMEHTPPRLQNAPVAPPVPQRSNVEVLHSIERPGLTPVYGTTCPPAGLSGAIRRMAFKRSENDVRHWLLLLLADRVNVVEGIGQDLARGSVPNVLDEMGIRAEWRYNRAGLVQKVAVTGAVLGIGWYLLRRRGQP